MHIGASARQFLARRPWVYWVGIVMLATLLALVVRRQLAMLDAARAEWDTTQTVLVAAGDLEPGAPIDVVRTELPLVAIPPSALDTLDDRVELRQRVAVGEILVEADVTAVPGPAGRAEPGTEVVGITDPLSRDVSIGLSVRVVADGLVLADQAQVVDVIDDVIFVNVESGDAPMIAAAARSDLVSLVYLP